MSSNWLDAEMNPGPVPESLRGRSLQPVWAGARRHLDRHGSRRRGSIRTPDLDPASALALTSMLGPVGRRLDLTSLEAKFVDLGVGRDLDEALTHLGHPPSCDALQRRAERARTVSARGALERAVEPWHEPWADEWAQAIVRAGLLSGLDGADVQILLADVRRLLDSLERYECRVSDPLPEDRAGKSELRSDAGSPPASRTELAAALFGSAHALDPGTRLASLVSRALRYRTGLDLEGRELWEAVGVQTDRVSAPALVWAVAATGHSTLAELLRSAAEGGLPFHASLLALHRHPVSVPAGTPVLAVENPRLVEAAAERGLKCCVVASNGNPSTAVTTLLGQMRESGATVWYHGDFDAAGIAICRRMHGSHCKPWMMASGDYRSAIQMAAESGVRLERDTKKCGPTPWDPPLEHVFDTRRLIVHEEFVTDKVLTGFADMADGASFRSR